MNDVHGCEYKMHISKNYIMIILHPNYFFLMHMYIFSRILYVHKKWKSHGEGKEHEEKERERDKSGEKEVSVE